MIKDYKTIIENCYSSGIELYVENGKLKYKSMGGALSKDILNELKSNREGLIEYIRTKQEKYNDKDLYSPFPLSPVQSSYLFGRGDLYSYGNVSCHIYQEFAYDELDVEKVQKVWNYLINKHDMLRAVIHQENYQEILEKVPEYNVKKSERIAIRKELENKIYPLEEWPMFDIGISKDKGKSILHFSMDFLIADWSSIWLLLTEFEDMYFDDFCNDEISSLSFKDYRIYEERKKESLEYEDAKKYWKEKVVGIKPAPTLPLKSIKEDEIPKFKRMSMTLNKNNWGKFEEIAQQKGITSTAAVLAVYSEVLKKWSANKEFSLNLTLFNKKQIGKNINNLIGDFTNTSIIPVESEELSFKDLASGFSKEIFNNLDHSSYSGVEVLRDLAKINSNKEFIVPYVFTSAIGLVQKKLRGEYRYGISQTPQVFIDCQAMNTDLGLQINWDVRDKLFEEDLIEDMFKAFEDTINQLAKSEDMWEEKLIISIPSWQKDERVKVNATEKSFVKNTLIFDFSENVKKNPEKIAVIDSKGDLSYKELYEKAVEIAVELKQKSINKGEYVIVRLPHNADQVACVLGVLMAGAIYVPVDIDTSRKRFESIIKQCNSRVIITDEELDERCVNIININDIEIKKDTIKAFEIEDIDPDSIAYVIFTSGTTGVPKGVVISHFAALNTIYGINQRFGVTKEDSVLAISKLNFDLSVYDIFGMLSIGGTIIYPKEEDYLNPTHWDELIQRYSISIWNTVPALMELYLSHLKGKSESRESMHVIFLSGDWIPLKMPDTLKEIFLKSKIIALGGATEASIWSNYHEYKGLKNGWTSIPYGKPLSNQQFYVLDENLEDCPVYCEGNLYISGDGLAKGYLGDEKLTEEKFSIHPKKRRRLYSTGDLGRYLPGGEIEFLGRKDSQVKIRGYRIELGEIKNALIRQEGISDAVVRVNKEKEDLPIEAVVIIEKTENKCVDDIINEELEEDLKTLNQEYENNIKKTNYLNYFEFRDKVLLNSILNTLLESDILKPNSNNCTYYINMLEVEKRYQWVIKRWIYQLEKRNLIKKVNEKEYLIERVFLKEEMDNFWRRLFDEWREEYGDKNLLYYIYDNATQLMNLLKGEISPIKVLYPNGSDKYATSLYKTSAISRIINPYYSRFLKAYIECNRNQGRKIRILEIGAGTGATTNCLIDILGESDYEYYFTDSEDFFLSKASELYKEKNNITVRNLNIDNDYKAQGFEPNYFDIVISAYVLNNAKNQFNSIQMIKEMMAPKGFLLFSEPNNDEPWLMSSQVFTMNEPQDKSREEVFFRNSNSWIELLNKIDGTSETYKFPEEHSSLYDFGAVLFIKQFKKTYSFINRKEVEKDILEYIPEYMKPSHILYMSEFPLTRNGKIDRKQVFSYLDSIKYVDIGNKKEYKTSVIEDQIRNICQDVLNVKFIPVEANIYDFGVDSLIMAKIATKIRNELNVNIPFEVLLRQMVGNSSIKGITDAIESYNMEMNRTDNENEDKFIYSKVYKDSEEINTLRVLVHAAFGSINNYENLAQELIKQKRGSILLIGVADTDKFLGMDPEHIVTKLADAYIEKILEYEARKVQIVGHSFSGVIALEIARRLLEKGVEIINLSIIEGGTIPTNSYDELILELVFLQLYSIKAEDLNISQETFLGDLFKKGHNYDSILTIENLIKVLKDKKDQDVVLQLKKKEQSERFDKYYKLIKDKKLDKISKDSLFNLYEIYKKTFDAQSYVPDMYFGDIDYYVSKGNVGAFQHMPILIDMWNDVIIGNINKFEIPGDHYTCIASSENAKILSEKLNQYESDK